MVAYFKRQNTLFMVLGAVIFCAAAILFGKNWIMSQEFYSKAFFMALPAFAGIAAGRIFSGRWASNKLRRLDNILYQKVEPKAFMEEFAPMVEHVPKQTVEYVNGKVKLAYAYEIMGEFEKSLEQLQGLQPKELHLHALAAEALMENQKMRVYLLSGDVEQGEKQLEILKQLQHTASGRASSLEAGLGNCIKLSQVWLDFLKEEEIEDTYIEEELRLASNEAYRREMQLLLGKMKYQKGEREEARKLWKPLTEYGKELYVSREAKRLLESI